MFGGARTFIFGLGGLEYSPGLLSIVGDRPAGGASTGAANTLDGILVGGWCVSIAGNAIIGFGLASSIGTSFASDTGKGAMDGGPINDGGVLS